MLLTDSSGHDHPAPSSIALNQPTQVLASRRLVRLAAGETLTAAGDFELTNDVISSTPLPIRYDVGARLAMILAPGPQSTSGTPLAASSRLITWREHHFTFTPSRVLRVTRALRNRTMYVNVVASTSLAHPPSACVSPYAGQPVACAVTFQRSLSQLGVIRVSASGARSDAPPAKSVGAALLPSPLETDPSYGHRMIVWSSAPVRIGAGDIVDVSARLGVSARALTAGVPEPSGQETGCNALISGQLYLSANRRRATGSSLPALSGDTGFNLTQASPVASLREHGFWQAPNADYGRRYVELVAWSSRSQACPDRRVAVIGAASAVSMRIFHGRG